MTDIFKSLRIIDGKARWIIIDENKNIINKYPSKNDLKNLQTENYKIRQYKDEELLNYLKEFYQENGRIPIQRDFVNNHEYPGFEIYHKRFGSWNNALKLVGMDWDTMIEQGNLETANQKGRSWEILVRDILNGKSYLENKSVDLSGENCHSTYDGICPNGKTYDAKSSKLHIGGYWSFHTANKDKDEDKEAIEVYHFGAFNEDYTKLLYVWEVPGEMVESDYFYVGINGINCRKFNVENMKEYDITDKFKELYERYKAKKILKSQLKIIR